MGRSQIEILLWCIAAAASGYLMGSLNFAIIISNVFYGDDIRKHGSGNAGTTNMLRTFGKKAALFTLLGDLFKGVIAAVGFGLIFTALGYEYKIGGAIAGLFAVFGHNWPVFFKFKGGKGVLTSFAIMLAIMPLRSLACFAVLIIVVAITKYVSLGSVLAAVTCPVITIVTELEGSLNGNLVSDVLLIFAGIVSVLVVVRHRENIKRLIQGKENKLSFKKKG